jgi:poly(hydroxyalkanoate) depolymerase family esterase
MRIDFIDAMRRATLATRANDVGKATEIVLQAVTGRLPTGDIDAQPARSTPSTLRLIDSEPNAQSHRAGFQAKASTKARMPLGDVLRALRQRKQGLPHPEPDRGIRPVRPPSIPDGARFLTRSFSCAAGGRDYKLYVPASRSDAPRGLIIMLHGCTQNPDDFAAGTNMNAVAESHGLLVAYPHQTTSANVSACWNWFNPADQMREGGEPSVLAGLTQNVLAEFAVDPRSAFVAGLSAGGAMAAVLGATYPELFAAVGVHSGLPYRSARDVASAFTVMRGGALAEGAAAKAPGVPTIVFHGTNDRTVHPTNAERIVEAARDRHAAGNKIEEIRGVEGGRGYARTNARSVDGAPVVEFWRIEGGGHAWSGGCHEGSFADPKGPSASAEMVRFFLAQAPRG